MLETKIYVDGFMVDKISATAKSDDMLERALTPKVLELLKEEEREVLDIIEVPQGDPSCIFIVTQL